MLRVLGWLLLTLGLLAVPALTVWLKPSLVAFFSGPPQLALAGGLLLFPILPLLWEWRATRAWERKVASRTSFGRPPRRTFSAFTRLALRTVLISLIFIGAMVVQFPRVTFSALATRGDWFLAPGQGTEVWRGRIFWLAQALEGLHRIANPNPYASTADHDTLAKVEPGPAPPVAALIPPVPAIVPPLAPVPAAPPDAGLAVVEVPTDDGDDEGTFSIISNGQTVARAELRPATPTEGRQPAWAIGGTHWPWKDEVSPTVKAMGPADETSIAEVARFIAAREPEPFQRVKALHDWVVTRLRYDEAALKGGPHHSQTPNDVFAGRLAVCEGYARLMVELGAQTHDEVVYLTGEVREQNGAAAPIGHAWNSVKIDGTWYLLDATWDDPVTQDHQDAYRTDYLFTPPSIAIFSHFPDDSRWQLLEHPLSRGDFLRQPFTRPGLAKEGLTLISPDRASIDVRDEVRFEIDNPLRRHLTIHYREGSTERECGIQSGPHVVISCPVQASGEATIFAGSGPVGRFEEVVSIAVTRR